MRLDVIDYWTVKRGRFAGQQRAGLLARPATAGEDHQPQITPPLCIVEATQVVARPPDLIADALGRLAIRIANS